MGCRRGRGDDQKTIHAAQRRPGRCREAGWCVASSGKHERRRRWAEPEEGNGDVGAMQGFRGAVERWGGRVSRGGAPELVGGARAGRRRWLWRTAATVVFGRARERARERRGEPGESEREQGGGVVSSGASRRGGEGRQAGREVAWRGGARAPATLPSLCRDEDDRGGRWAGPAAGWAGQLAGLNREEPR